MESHRIPPGATCLWDKSVPKSIPVGTTCVPPTLPHNIGAELSPSFGNQTFKGLLNTREDAATAPARPGSVNTCPAPVRSKQGQGGKRGGALALDNLDFMLQCGGRMLLPIVLPADNPSMGQRAPRFAQSHRPLPRVTLAGLRISITHTRGE